MESFFGSLKEECVGNPIYASHIEGALAISSKKRLQEAFAVYQQIPHYWRDEPRMRQVIERFHLSVEGVN